MTNDTANPTPSDLAVFNQVIRYITHRRRLPADDAQDFAQSVHLRLVQTNYELFRQFEGRSSLRTYLTVAVARLLMDWRNSRYGKWRASAAANRLGDAGVRLERLINRDRYSVQEAIASEMLRAGTSGPEAAAALNRIVEQLPARPRRRFVSEEVLDRVTSTDFVDPIAAAEEEEASRRLRIALAAALRELPADDRRLIDLRYKRQCTMKAAADVLRQQPEVLYRRTQSVLVRLRRKLRASGVLDGGYRRPSIG